MFFVIECDLCVGKVCDLGVVKVDGVMFLCYMLMKLVDFYRCVD